jgi:exoribonuclease II
LNETLKCGIVARMAMSEAARADLYNGLSDLLGPERAETLMTHLPRYDPAEVATKSDFAELRSNFSELRSDFAELRSDFRSEISELRTEMTTGFAGVNERFDRMYLTLVAGFFVVVAAMAGVVFTSL